MKFQKELKATLLEPTFRHIKYSNFPINFWGNEEMKITIAKGEKFAFQLMLNYQHTESLYILEKKNIISWKGLIDRVRIDFKIPNGLEKYFNASFIGYVKDDTGTIVSDPILLDKSILVEKGISQCLWFEGVVPRESDLEDIKLQIDLFTQEGYEDEEKVKSIEVNVEVINFSLDELNESDDFHLDLWQHPSNWSRMYNVELWSNEHFEIIKNNLKELASLGNKVITAIVSDFPWAGQLCYEEEKNPSNLFEYNMIGIIKNKTGKFIYDYKALDRYIELSLSLGMDKEINLFGISGVWDMGFGNPLKDYEDPIRLNYYDELSDTLKYIDNKKDVEDYIVNLFDHLYEKGWWDIVKVMSDHPVEDKVFEECKDFIEKLGKGKKVVFKSAIFKGDVMKKHSSKIDEVSLSSSLTIQMIDELKELKTRVNSNGGKVTWYVCWFPEKLNNFIKSPLIENRLIGWYTYYFGLDGFLRWDYAIWPNDPWDNPSYKFPYWSAGDMYFIYPGANLKPVRTQRWENLRFGIQDFQMFKHLERKGYKRSEIEEKFMKSVLGDKKNLKAVSERSIDLKYEEDYKVYDEIKKLVLNILKDETNN